MTSKPHGADKGQRAPQGEALTFDGDRLPTDPDLREQFLRIRKEYMDQKEAYKAEMARSQVRNWKPHATQLQYLQFMKIEMAKGHLNLHKLQGDRCLYTSVSAADINLNDGAEMKSRDQ